MPWDKDVVVVVVTGTWDGAIASELAVATERPDMQQHMSTKRCNAEQFIDDSLASPRCGYVV
jgi:hypothetical protein